MKNLIRSPDTKSKILLLFSRLFGASKAKYSDSVGKSQPLKIVLDFF